MKTPNFTKFVQDVRSSVVKHSPQILTAVGITGVVTTVVMAVKATPKALELIEEAKQEQEVETLSPVETVKATWKCYIPTAVIGTVSVACLLSANSIHTGRTAALATAYKISETALAEYKDAVIETVGEKKAKDVRDKVAEKRMEKDPVTNHDVIFTGNGTSLCYDGWAGRYFESDKQTIERAVNVLNNRMFNDNYVSLNEFYVEIGLDPVTSGNRLGWNLQDGMIELDFSAQLSKDGRPCLVFDFEKAPEYGFSSLM